MSTGAIVDSNLVGDGKRFREVFAKGKVRDVYEIDKDTLLFVATDRISAYDVVLANGIPDKGSLLTKISVFWFDYLSRQDQVQNLKTHLISAGLPSGIKNALPEDQADQLSRRSMVVRKLEIFPIESIVRGYITGSAWKEYQASGTVHGIPIKEGMLESDQFEGGAIWTPSTKAKVGEKDENIHPSQAASLVGGEENAKKIEELSIELYKKAHKYAYDRGIIIADTKFEFGKTPSGEIVLVDEVLTPDSSRFWPRDKYKPGRSQDSYDKQFLRDWLTANGLKGKEGVTIPDDVVQETRQKYEEVVDLLTKSSSTSV